MPIIEIPPNRTPAERAKQRINAELRMAYAALRRALETGKREVWQNKDATPQEVFDAYGGNAAQLCAISDAAKQLLALVGDDFGPILPPGMTLTVNPDGTVTVGDAE